VGVEETDHVVVAATSRVEVLQVLSGHGEPDDEDDSREGDAHPDDVLSLSGGCYRRGRCPSLRYRAACPSPCTFPATSDYLADGA
jgi:hypothetical protein